MCPLIWLLTCSLIQNFLTTKRSILRNVFDIIFATYLHKSTHSQTLRSCILPFNEIASFFIFCTKILFFLYVRYIVVLSRNYLWNNSFWAINVWGSRMFHLASVLNLSHTHKHAVAGFATAVAWWLSITKNNCRTSDHILLYWATVNLAIKSLGHESEIRLAPN